MMVASVTELDQSMFNCRTSIHVHIGQRIHTTSNTCRRNIVDCRARTSDSRRQQVLIAVAGTVLKGSSIVATSPCNSTSNNASSALRNDGSAP